MKFNNWTLDDLIKYLQMIKTTDYFDYRCVPRVFGEIYMINGEDKTVNGAQNEHKTIMTSAELVSETRVEADSHPGSDDKRF